VDNYHTESTCGPRTKVASKRNQQRWLEQCTRLFCFADRNTESRKLCRPTTDWLSRHAWKRERSLRNRFNLSVADRR